MKAGPKKAVVEDIQMEDHPSVMPAKVSEVLGASVLEDMERD